ncbi:MAG: hypothetical protein RhofKO_17830 [Rhodothermales bacterium]
MITINDATPTMTLTPRLILMTSLPALVVVMLSGFDYSVLQSSTTPPALETEWTVSYDDERMTAAQIIEAHGGLFPDASLQTYLQKVSERVADTAPVQYAPQFFSFYLTADTTAQVIGLRTGEILVSIGLLKQLKSEDALAQVVAGQVVLVMTDSGAVCRLARPDGSCYQPSDLTRLIMAEAGYQVTQAQVVRA